VSTDSPSGKPSDNRIPLLGRAAVAALTVLPLLPTLRAAFVYDDTTVIRDNLLLRGWGAVWRVWTTPYWPSDGLQSLGLYRPLQLSLLAFVWNIGQGMAPAFHVYALCLALGSSFSLWWVLRRGANGLAALIAALWFATHPLHIEAVASVANTSELVVMLTTIGMVRLLLRAPPSNGWIRPLAVGALAAAALAAKESGLLALPVAAITAWGWTSARGGAEPFRDFCRLRVRDWIASAIGLMIVIAARLMVLGTPVSTGSIAAQGLGTFAAGERILAMMSLWPRIGRMVLWPSSLVPYYGPSVFPAHRVAMAVAGLVILALLVAVAVRAQKRGDQRPLVALAWMVLTYLPASNILTATGQILSDRTLFGVTAGAAFFFAWTLDIASRRMLRVARVVWIVLLAHNLLVGSRYALVWSSHRTLWAELARISPNEHMSYKLLGMDARGRKDYASAVTYLSRALSMVPSDRQIRFELGQAQYSTGDYAGAVSTLAPLLKDGDVRKEPGFVALYLDAVGRSAGAPAVADAARRLLHTEADSVARTFLDAATRRPQ
jgi:hypothetical protein